MNKKQIENIVWHIETNRIVAGDKRVLDDVLKSLKNFLKETAQEVPVQEQSIKDILSEVSTLLITASSITRKALENNFND